MKLSKFLSMILIITSFSLIYVWQQSEIFRLAYIGQKRTVVFEDLLDKNSFLRYNIGKSASLVNIGNAISKEAEFEMPQSYGFLRVSLSRPSARVRLGSTKTETLLSRLLSAGALAEARTINP